MFTNRFIIAMLSAALLLAASVGPTAARRPGPPPERPLTAQEQAASERKIAAAEAYVATADAQDISHSLASVTSWCPTPEGIDTQATTNETTTDETTHSCTTTPSGFLSVSARDQVNGMYCGPAVGQVIANYSWIMAASADRYSQKAIAGWMRTDANGGTSAPWLASGLNTATHGSPREPGTWTWIVTDLLDRNANGDKTDELYTYVRSNISASRMPLAIPVKPHDKYAEFRLSSWPKPVKSPGHWIAAYGWHGTYAKGTDGARVYYTDSSRDEGGATGKFWDPTRHLATMISVHTGRLVW